VGYSSRRRDFGEGSNSKTQQEGELMATHHTCDVCNLKIKGDTRPLQVSLNPAGYEKHETDLDVCNDCAVSLGFFRPQSNYPFSMDKLKEAVIKGFRKLMDV
jgi:hypothetical protein